MNKKYLLAKFLSYTALLPIARKVQTSLSNKLIILAYHRIYDMGKEDDFPFDPELISATPQEFKIQMSYIKKHFNPVTLHDVINYQQDKKTLPKKPIIVTFDDGHLDNYTEAFPILKSLKMPATIFLSTDYMTNNKIFWFDWVAHVVYLTSTNRLSINKNEFTINIDKTISSRRLSTEKILEYLKTLPNQIRINCLDEIKIQLKVEVSENNKIKSSALEWKHIIEMSTSNIEFGSHTVSHPILSKLNNDELKHEVEYSKSDIEYHINKTVETIAYPVGGTSEFSDDVIDACKSANYTLGLSYISGIESLPIKNLFEIKRLHIERYTNFDLFKAMVSLPSIFK